MNFKWESVAVGDSYYFSELILWWRHFKIASKVWKWNLLPVLLSVIPPNKIESLLGTHLKGGRGVEWGGGGGNSINFALSTSEKWVYPYLLEKISFQKGLIV